MEIRGQMTHLVRMQDYGLPVRSLFTRIARLALTVPTGSGLFLPFFMLFIGCEQVLSTESCVRLLRCLLFFIFMLFMQ